MSPVSRACPYGPDVGADLDASPVPEPRTPKDLPWGKERGVGEQALPIPLGAGTDALGTLTHLQFKILGAMASRLDAITAEQHRILTLLERLAPPSAAPSPDLLDALAEETGGQLFTVAETLRLAGSRRVTALLEGEPEPALSAALAAAGLTDTYGLSRWLSAHESQRVSKEGRDSEGTLWRVMVSEASKTLKT